MSLTDLLAFITILLWPVIPLFWIPVHGLPNLFRKLDVLTYIVPLVLWPVIAYLLAGHREFLLRFRVELPMTVRIVGVILFAAGTALHVWTIKLLRLTGIMGLPEVSSRVKGRLVTAGPFSVVRHPTYLAHTLMLAGVFLMTQVAVVGIIALLDFIVVNAAIIPLEDRELEGRFGEEYGEYRKQVPAFFPYIFGKKR